MTAPEFTSVSVMMGAVSETDSLRQTVYGIAAAVEKKSDIAELLIAYPPDRVTPECRAVLDELANEDVGVRLDIFPQQTPGIGFYSDALDRATGSHCIPFQTDMAMPLQIIARLIEEIKKDPTVFITTSRWLPECRWSGYGKVKKVINKLAQMFLRVLFGGGLTDYTNPVQIIPTGLMKRINWEETDFSRFMELQIKPLRLGCRFREIPVDCLERTDGETNNGSIQILHYLKTAVRLRFIKKENILK